MSARILTIAPGMAEDVARDVGLQMRELDALECRAHGVEPIAGVMLSIEASLHAETIWEPERGFGAAWGIVAADMLTGPAYLWLLTAHWAPDYRKQLLRHGKKFAEQAAETYGTVEAQVLKSYGKSVTMLRHWGFDMEEVVVVNGHPFFTARKRAHAWVSPPLQ